MAEPFCTIGDLVLQLAESPGAFKEKYGFEYADHAVLEGKPKVQAIGGKLDEIQIEFQHHVGKSDIGFIANRLLKMLDQAEVVALTMGDGEYLGQFVVADLNFDRTATFSNGTSMAATFGVTLREYVGSSPLEITNQPAVKKSNPAKKGTQFTRDPITGQIVPKK